MTHRAARGFDAGPERGVIGVIAVVRFARRAARERERARRAYCPVGGVVPPSFPGPRNASPNAERARPSESRMLAVAARN